MTVTKTCDLCGEPAISEIYAGAKNDGKSILTDLKKDVCEEHFLLFKKTVHFFTGQSDLPLVIEKIKIEVVEKITHLDEDVSPTND